MASSFLSPDDQDPANQLRKNTYIRFQASRQAGYVTPLAEVLLNVAAAMCHV
jgi:hypothetical protein